MLLHELYGHLGEDRLRDMLRHVSLGKLKTFQMFDRVSFKGGYRGGTTNPDDYDPQTFITILSGDIDENNNLDTYNSNHVVTAAGRDDTADLSPSN